MGALLSRGVILPSSFGDEAVPPGGVGDPWLAPLANRPLLEYALETMRDAGVHEVAVVAGPRRADALRPAVESGLRGMSVEIVENNSSTGPLAALIAAEPFLEGAPCLVHCGEGMVRDDVNPCFQELATDDLDALMLVHPAEPGRLGELSGFLLFGDGVLPRVRDTAAGGATTIIDALERILRDGSRARAHRLHGWHQVMTSGQLLQANRIVLDDLEAPGPQATLTRSRVEGRVAIHPTASVEDAVIRGPGIIGAGARIRHSYIGPYSSIGDDVEIEGAEIEHSVILPRAAIKHLGGRLEASVIGRDARITRDFALPRAIRVRLADGGEISLA
jgi:glucose-1-phosphate thymidylyltransferase